MRNWTSTGDGCRCTSVRADLTQRAAVDRHCIECVDAKGATHVHLHVNAKKEDRLAELRDLLDNFPGVRQPDGCNEAPTR